MKAMEPWRLLHTREEGKKKIIRRRKGRQGGGNSQGDEDKGEEGIRVTNEKK